jgi:hypothetical protein
MQLVHQYLGLLYHLLHLLPGHRPILHVIFHLSGKADYGFQAKLRGVISRELHEFLHGLLIGHVLHRLKRETRQCCQSLVIFVITARFCLVDRLTSWLGVVMSSLILFEPFPSWSARPSRVSLFQRARLLLLLH